MPSHTRLAAAFLLLAGSVSLKAQTAARVDLAVSFLADRSLQANTGERSLARTKWREGRLRHLGLESRANQPTVLDAQLVA